MWDIALLMQAVLVGAGILVARAALVTARTPQGAAAWVVFLVSFPLLALPAYALFGGIARINASPKDRHGAPEDADPAARLATLAAIARAPVTEGNDLRLLVDGAETFDAIFAAIEAAEHEVVVQFYILRSDVIGRALQDRLIAASERGVEVKVLCDLVGSFFLGFTYVRALREAGVGVRGIPGAPRRVRRIGINYRNHRKCVVLDGRVGFTGGINVGDEYVDGGRRFERWRDTHLRIEGPMVAQLRDLFAADWTAVTGEALAPSDVPPAAGARRGLVTGTGPTDAIERGSLLWCGLAGLAERRLWIASPYLVPHTDLLTALELASLRGVDVRILIPAPSDNVLAWYAARAYGPMLRRTGIAVHEYLSGFMHQKVVLIDDDVASVGTVNLDIRSALLNFEETALVEDRGFAAEVEAMLTADFARARPLPQRPSWHVRLLAPVARLAGPLL
ncbi:cardiolipin synthase [Jannaschia sp. LMIT008]|uniref:cardiolipin synthase n=1 Tax=Jannaschia maritima TaxID=3032585 RepID=UPI002810D75F|nr:cardiolipin synthase [Jannaschia sp. LMIT008]